MTRWNPDLFPDYQRFHALACATHDVDPVYPVLNALARDRGMSADEVAWLGLLHVAYYDLGSALLAYEHTGGRPSPPDEVLTGLPCATERRGHRDPVKLGAHLSSLHDRIVGHGGAAAWLRWLADDAGRPSYRTLFAGIQGVYSNGRWAAYKTCELMSHLLRPFDPDWELVEPTDMGHAHSSGPRHGLALLADVPDGNSPAVVERLDILSTGLCNLLAAAGLPSGQAVAETTLCDFHSLVRGRYYVGHDIDQMATQLRRAQGNPDVDGSFMLPLAWASRAAALPGAYLGELADPPRYTVDVDRRRVYARDREIIERVQTVTA